MHIVILILKIATFHTAYFLKFYFLYYSYINYSNTGGRPSMGPTSFNLELFFFNVHGGCIYTCSLGMEFFNLQVYM